MIEVAAPPSDRTLREPGAALLHPIALVSLLVLVVNDHWLKRAWPSPLTGKLSDFAGLVLTPLVLHAAYERLGARWGGKPSAPRRANRALCLAAAAVSLAFALVELWGPAETAYRQVWAVLQWPARALSSLLGGGAMPGLAPVTATADVGDLLALPMALLAVAVGWQPQSSHPERGPRVQLRRVLVRPARRGAPSLLLAALGWAPAARAQATEDTELRYQRGGYTHDGFYAALELGVGPLLLDSQASVSNGFRQAVPSSARGAVAPALGVAAGGTLPGGLVLGVRVLLAESPEPVIDTLGRSFQVPDFRVNVRDVALFAEYYPDMRGGLHFGGSVGLLALSAGQTRRVLEDVSFPDSEEQRGFSLSLDAGYSHWLQRQLSIGGRVRLFAGRTTGDHGETLVLAPLLLGSLSWH